MPTIPVPFDSLKLNYPRRPALTPELKRFMDALGAGNTPCCVQISHCLNMTGQRITKTYLHQRRDNARIIIGGSDYYYVLAVDEMEKYLSQKYGTGEIVQVDETGKKRSASQIKTYLQGRQGILVFRDGGAGFHTELWNGKTIEQAIANGGDVVEDPSFMKPRVLFWDCGPPQWLVDYMSAQP